MKTPSANSQRFNDACFSKQARSVPVQFLLVCAVTLATLVAPSRLWAEQDLDLDQDEAQLLRAQGTILPLEDILGAARRLHDGRIVEVELKLHRERYIYEIEIVDPAGRVWEMKFDARSASLVSQEQED